VQSLIDFAKLPYGLGQVVDQRKFHLLVVLRAECSAVRGVWRVQNGDEHGEAEETLSDGFGSMIIQIAQCWQELCHRVDPLNNWTWWDTLMHRLLIVFHLFGLELLELANGNRRDMLHVKHGLKEVINLLRNDVTKTNPAEAQRLITFLIELFIAPENRAAYRRSISIVS